MAGEKGDTLMAYRQPRKADYTNISVPTHTDWLTIDQACAYMQVDRRTLNNYRNSGKIEVRKLGHTVRISKKSLDEFVASWPKGDIDNG